MKRSAPRISVIVPAYNAENHIEASVRSVMSRCGEDMEIIIVDDGSTDGTGKIADRLADFDHRIIVVHVKNGGLSYARNQGLDIARGEMVFFLDSDDLFHPEAIDLMVGVLETEDADIVVGKDVRGEEPGEDWLNSPLAAGATESYDSEGAIEAELYQRHDMNSVCFMALRRRLFEEPSPLRFREGITYEDLDIADRLYSRAKKTVYTPAPVYFYRRTEGSILQTVNRKRLDVLEVTRRIEERIEKEYPRLKGAARDRRFSANFNIFALLSKADSGEYSEELNETWGIIRSYRHSELKDPKVRLKNKAGALLSYLGQGLTGWIARIKK